MSGVKACIGIWVQNAWDWYPPVQGWSETLPSHLLALATLGKYTPPQPVNAARIDLPQFKLVNTIELPLSIDSSDSVAMDVQPGSDTTLVVGFGSPWGGEDVSVVDVNGSTATVPSGEGDLYAGEWPQFGDATHIYSIDTYGSPQTFYRITLNPEGGTPAIASTFGIDLGSAIEIGQDGLVYGASGVIFDGRQKQLEQIAAVPNGGYLVAPDTPQGRAFYMQAGFGGDGTDSVMRADIERYVDEEVLALPTSTQGSAFADAIVRWGQDGLAILSQHPSSNGNGGPARMAELCGVAGLGLDRAGNLYIADGCNYRVRKVTFPKAASAPAF